MRKHHVLAVALAGLNVAALLVDTAVVAATGQRTFVTDDSRGSDVAVLVSGAVLGITFLAMALVVLREAPLFADARRTARLVRPVLLVGLLLLGGGFLTVHPLQTLSGLSDDALVIQISGVVAFAALAATSLSALVIGLAVIGHNPLGVGGQVLGWLVPVLLVTILLTLVAPKVASPVFGTMVVLVGVSLIGVRATPLGLREGRRPTVTSPTSVL